MLEEATRLSARRPLWAAGSLACEAPCVTVFTSRVVLMLVFVLILAPASPILLTGRWDWWEVWVYLGINVVGFAGSRALAARRHPGLLEERAHSFEHEDTERFDKVLAPLVGFGGVALPIVAGLDARFGAGVVLPLGVKIGALAVIVAGYAFASWALIENRFFSGTVRIQKERGHVVVDTGPYRMVRHPGYAGVLAVYAATPPLLDSWWTFVPAGVLAVLLVVRTALEDGTLQAKLPGYVEYTSHTRWRLLPGIW